MIEISHLNHENKLLEKKFINELSSIIKSKNYILGNKVKIFEKNFSRFAGCSFTVGLNSGLDALIFSLISVGIKKGDYVVTTSVSAYATALAIYHIGAIPIFLDIDVETGLISYEELVKIAKKKKINSLILVHLYGRIHPKIQKIINFCKKEKITIIEDCAQSHGAKYKNLTAGSIGKVAAWSFYPTKNLGAVGDAGAITSNNTQLINKCKKIRNYGQSSRYKHVIKGVNSRMDELQAGILIERLKYLELWNKKRKKIAEKYNKQIKNPKIEKLKRIKSKKDSFYLYVIKSKNRNKLVEYLNKKDIKSIIHYPILSYKQKFNFKYKKFEECYNAEEISKTCLSIPCHPFLKKKEINKIIKILNEF